MNPVQLLLVVVLGPIFCPWYENKARIKRLDHMSQVKDSLFEELAIIQAHRDACYAWQSPYGANMLDMLDYSS